MSEEKEKERARARERKDTSASTTGFVYTVTIALFFPLLFMPLLLPAVFVQTLTQMHSQRANLLSRLVPFSWPLLLSLLQRTHGCRYIRKRRDGA